MKMDLAIRPAQRAREGRSLRPVTLGLALLILYALLWPGVTGDMRLFLLPWLDHILEHGMVGAFSIPFSNYTPPYLYLMALVSPLAAVVSKISLVKSLSIAGTLVLAAAVRQLLRSTGRKFSVETLLCLMLLPSVAINAVGFGQCDAIWSAACVMAVASAVCRRPLAMLIWFGVAASFKAQAIFLGPFVVLQLLRERVPLRLWPIPGLVYGVAMVPAALAGWPVDQLATVYFHQAEWNPAFVSTATNPWSLVEYWSSAQAHHWFWLGYAAAAVAGIGYALGFRRRGQGDAADMILLALLSACILPFLLPKMHERFFFLADVLAFVLVVVRRDWRSMLILAFVQCASMLAIGGVMLKAPLYPVIGTPMMLAAMLLVIDELWRATHARAPCPWEPARGTASPFTSERARIRAF